MTEIHGRQPVVLLVDDELHQQSAAGLLLGLVAGPMYTPGRETVLTLEPSSSLLLFSDDLTVVGITRID